MPATGPDPLKRYREKRTPSRTPEPAGKAIRPGGQRFVIQQHAARRLHYDLRLEMDGVLKSWAVPKGPSLDPKEKRLAVHVEDHPLDYGDFEGLIPSGNYGAGAVILWDRGVWLPLEDIEEGWKKGKLLFELRGYKLRGIWTLVKLKKGENEWLLIREKAEGTEQDDSTVPPQSILSGLTVEELRDGVHPGEAIRQELDRERVTDPAPSPEEVSPMLAEQRDTPFTRKGWLFELKLDGYRILAGRRDGEVVVRTRNGNDAATNFPEVALAVKSLPFHDFLMDGEVVALGADGMPSFDRLQERARLSRPRDVAVASAGNPVTYFAFDLLSLEGRDLRRMPLRERKALLRRVLPPVGPLRYVEDFEELGEALYEKVTALGLEGIVGKKADSLYHMGRSADWVKIRADQNGDFAVVGFTEPKGSRDGIGALHLAEPRDGRLVYAGRAGSGLDPARLGEIRASLEASARKDPPCEGAPKLKDTTWVEPEFVAQVRFKERTKEGLLRHPVFERFRDDKEIAELHDESEGEPPPLPVVEIPPMDPDQVPLSNVDKVFWPEEGYTKGDLIEYYRGVADWVLPFLKDRLVVLTRYPDGIDGKSFFQKDAPEYIPEWLRTERMWSEHAEREIDYFVCDDIASLIYLANSAAIPLHVWGSRISTLERPDWCILDLDPKEAPFGDVVAIANELHALCERCALPNYIKTSGSSGLHVLVPVGRQFTFEQTRALGEVLARAIVKRLPEIATITRQVSRRKGKVYVDFLQNGHGRLLVAPYSVRPLPGAPVSTPLTWDEVNPDLSIAAFTIETMPERLTGMKEDPLLPVLDEVPDLVRALELLQKEF